ncbi:MAG: GH3 auxin-responsive promoter family protein [Bacteroidia bacterium]|nr:GH3 auxin-responsive promoter family protein [Bacteroidia bacterium]
MALLGNILKRAVGLRKTIDTVNEQLDKLKLRRNAYAKQKAVLKKILIKASETNFGKHYHFQSLIQTKDFVKGFQKIVPLHDYDLMYDRWWHKIINGDENVCWPGKTQYFALSSGTSEAASKYIPVTKDQITVLRKTGVRQLTALAYFNLPETIFTKGWLMIGGSTDLKRNAGGYEGDLSGITANNLPFWFQRFYKPGTKIARERDWNTKIRKMVENAPQWDIAFVAGVPSWIQMLFEQIIEHHKVKTIHDVWPNLTVYLHGGVAFEPYKKAFSKLVAKPLIYIETYLASEGFIAYQTHPNTQGMQLAINQGIFFEFVPFNETNFDENGRLKNNVQTLTIDQVEKEIDYAILLTTFSGAYRYLIGDTVRFTNLERNEIIITGRVKFFLSLCGEHLSVDNMTKGVQLSAQKLNLSIPEFTVAGVPHDGLFAHHWYIGCDEPVDTERFRELLDENLCQLNDDYAVERKSALKEIKVEVLPVNTFYDFMKKQGKFGSQTKFPRVLKGDKLSDWLNFINNRK